MSLHRSTLLSALAGVAGAVSGAFTKLSSESYVESRVWSSGFFLASLICNAAMWAAHTIALETSERASDALVPNLSANYISTVLYSDLP